MQSLHGRKRGHRLRSDDTTGQAANNKAREQKRTPNKVREVKFDAIRAIAFHRDLESLLVQQGKSLDKTRSR
jgi:hypothetical protein